MKKKRKKKQEKPLKLHTDFETAMKKVALGEEPKKKGKK